MMPVLAKIERRWWIGCLCTALSFAAIAQTNSSLNFAPFLWPTTVNRDAFVVFSLVATNDGAPFDYQLISAPSNAEFSTDVELDRTYYNTWSALFSWHTPSRASVGSTNLFVVKAFEISNPSISATGVVSIVVVDVPPISAIEMSNGVPRLQLTNLLSDRSYVVEWCSSLPSTNWSPLFQLSRYDSRSPLVTVLDTQMLEASRFYRLSPTADVYAFIRP